MNLFKLIAILLDYPHDDALADLRTAVGAYDGVGGLILAFDPDGDFAGGEREQIARVVETLLSTPATTLQADYVQTFDLVPEHSLHLTHHVFGDDKSRGPALIDLSEYYRAYGLKHRDDEIPDYLPMMLEFASQLDPVEARVFLSDAGKVLRVLAEHLETAASPYAPLIRIVETHATLARQAA